MSPEPKGNQEEIIKQTEGVYLVDAGAGTGKTFTVSRRYARLLEEGAKPRDIFLATFTENAADNMREEIINHCNYDLSELREAPISTFHGFCQRTLLREGFETPSYLGFEETITENTGALSNRVQENREFTNFFDIFMDNHPEYGAFYRNIYDNSHLLELIKSLAVKGVFPKKTGWYRNGADLLSGNYNKYLEKLEEVNTPVQGKRGKKQSRLLGRLNGMKDKTFDSDDVRDKYDLKRDKQVDPDVMKRAFKKDRSELLDFIHDVYFEYIDYCLGRNYLNFSFQLMFAYVLLMENEDLRESTQFDYVMIDEFQDTNEIQFKLSLLLSGTGNILAVGDWKQSIFGFQYASVKNITEFEDRFNKYHREINSDKRRTFTRPGEVEEITLRRNYRSSQEILNFSGGALKVRGKKKENVSLDRKVASLEAVKDKKDTDISAFVSDSEIEALLERLVRIVEKEEYEIDGKPIEYRDVAIFSRNRAFARELDKKARELGVPVSYEGGAEIFKSDPGVLLLAWLRVMEVKDSRRGWSVILDEAGYNIAEIETILESEDLPPDVDSFRGELKEAYDIGAIARKVFVRYGLDNTFTDAIIEVLQDTFDSSYMNLPAVIRFIESNIKEGETYEVDSPKEDAATVQTIHAAKGLEYPVVFVANMNSQTFPSTNSDGKRIFYDDLVGLRASKAYSETDGFIYDDLESYLVSRVTGVDYDEERRLLYVALTRAENYLFLSAEKGSEGRFFKDLDIEPEEIYPEPEDIKVTVTGEHRKKLDVKLPPSDRPEKKPVHSVVEVSSDDQSGGRGTEFGTMVHRFAEKVARGEDLEITEGERGEEDKKNVLNLIKSLTGKLHPEREVLVPRSEGGRRIVYHGSIDLLHVLDDRVQVIDYKTDLTRGNEQEYRKQLSLYVEGVASAYPDKKIEGRIFYTKTGKLVEL